MMRKGTLLRRMLTFLAFFGICYVLFVIIMMVSPWTLTSTLRISNNKQSIFSALPGFSERSSYRQTETSYHANGKTRQKAKHVLISHTDFNISSKRSDNAKTNSTHANIKLSHSVSTIHVNTSITNTPHHSIGIYFKGRFGNLMFQYASLYGIGKRNNLRPLIPSQFAIDKVFSLNSERVSRNYCKKYDKKYTELKGCSYESPAMELGSEGDVVLDGYFQSWKYFEHVQEDLRKQFTFKEGLMAKAQDQIRMLTHDANLTQFTLIGVHVRRGDMVDNKMYVDYGYISANKHYLHQAMNLFKNKYLRIKFLVVSDDIAWCKETLSENFDDDVFFVDGMNYPELDMAILSSCHHTVMTVGSFGWWAAWLAGGDVIYYKGYPRPGSRLFRLMNQSDYRYPSWIGM